MRGITGDVRLADGKRRLADISEAIGAVTLDFQVGQVSELSFPAVDPGGLLDKNFLKAGTRLLFDESSFDVAAVERNYLADRVDLGFTARSRLARLLRLMEGPDAKDKVTPAEWINGVVKKAGGKATVQPGAKARRIVQKRGESVLDVIANLAGDMATDWVEYGDRLFVGTGWWALNGGPELPTWPLRVGSQECFTFSSRASIDDKTDAATASVTVPVEVGRRWRPWHRVQVTKATDDDNGIWLITGVSFTLRDQSPASIELSRPLKSSVQKTGSGSQGNDPGIGDPVAGSSYSDAPVPRNWKGRSVKAIVNLYRNNPRGLGYTIYRGCLWYAQEAAGYPHFGDNPEVLARSLGGRLVKSKTVVPGAVCLYENADIGHAVVYLGGGKCLSTDMNSAGGHAPWNWSIGPIDAMEKSFGVTRFLGWYAP